MQSVSIQKAANILKSSRSHIYLLIQQKRLCCLEIGGKRVISQESLDRYRILKDQLEAIQTEMRKEVYIDAG